MRNTWKLAIALLMGVSSIQAEEIPIKSRLASIGLFKNGLAVVKKAISIPGPGTYRIDDVPEPVHGTFWIESGARVEARVTSRVVDVQIHNKVGADFQEELVGREVVIHFRDGGIPPATGKVVAVDHSKGEDAWNRTRQMSRYDSYNNISSPASSGRFLVLDGADGRSYVDSSMIAYLRAKGGDGDVKQRKPAFLLTVSETDRKPVEVFLSYLTRGISWAPSYRVDITNPNILELEQNAVIKNELEDIENAEISLISGFPSIQFAHVVSPFSLNTTWSQFFQELNRRIDPSNSLNLNVASQQAITLNSVAPERILDLSATPAGEGADIHYQFLGKRTLLEGDSLATSTASGKAPYKRIVEWIVPDTRQANGRYVEDYQRRQDPDKYEDAVWDAIRFKNPLPFPMTTAPAMTVSNGKFNGQQMSYWVNMGEETTLHITKALSIRTHHVEQEQTGSRDIVYIGASKYSKVAVKGELKINNHRKELVSIVIRRRFSGELLSADASPKCVLLEEGVSFINQRHELTWAVDLKPGEETTLAYQYSILTPQF